LRPLGQILSANGANGAERWGERTTWVPVIEFEPLYQAIPEGSSPLWSFLLCGSINSLADLS